MDQIRKLIQSLCRRMKTICVTTVAALPMLSMPLGTWDPAGRVKPGLARWAVLGQDEAALCMGSCGLKDMLCCFRGSSLASIAVLADEAD